MAIVNIPDGDTDWGTDGRSNWAGSSQKDATETWNGVKTVAGSLDFPTQVSRLGQAIFHAVNNASGFAANNVIFKADGPLSRGGPIWVDENDRHQVWVGWHDQLPDGGVHHGFEIKSAANPAGSFPAVMVTRFRVTSDLDQSDAAFYSTRMIYVENGIYSPNTAFGFTFNTPTFGSVVAGTATSNYKLAKIVTAVDGSGVATLHLAPGLDNTTGAKIALFRETDQSSGVVELNGYKGDNTATITWKVDSKLGVLYGLGRDGTTLKKAVLEDDPRIGLPAYKAADQTVNNSATLVNDTALTVAVAANTTYAIEGFLAYDTSATADIKVAFTAPAGATLLWSPLGLAGSSSGTSGSIDQRTLTTNNLALGGAGAGTNAVANPRGTLVTSSTAGSLTLQWAQNAAEVSDTKVKTGSWLKLTKLA